MGDNLLKLPEATWLAKRTMANMRQDITIALLIVGLLFGGVLLGGVTMAVGMLVHEAPALVVIANAVRPLRRRGLTRPAIPTTGATATRAVTPAVRA